MQRVLLVLSVSLVAASCRDAKDRPDAAGGLGGTMASGGSGGSTSTGSAGSTGGGVGGVGGSSGTDVDAPLTPPADAGSDDGSGSGADVAADAANGLEPIRVSDAKVDGSQSYSNLRIVGVALDQYDGDVVTFRIGSGSGAWRFGSGQVRIVQGAFDVSFTGVLAPTYEQKIVHIDADGSGACEVGEPTFLDNGLFSMDATLTVKPTDAQFRSATSGVCDMVNAPPPY